MQSATKTPPQTIPPCFDYRYFYGIGVVVLNDPMADALSSALQRSDLKNPVIEAIAKDLVGNVTEVDFDDRTDDPSYSYTYFRNCGTLMVNKAASSLLSEAIFLSAGGRQISPHLWSLHYQLKNNGVRLPSENNGFRNGVEKVPAAEEHAA